MSTQYVICSKYIKLVQYSLCLMDIRAYYYKLLIIAQQTYLISKTNICKNIIHHAAGPA